jgi:hypothetical protein
MSASARIPGTHTVTWEPADTGLCPTGAAHPVRPLQPAPIHGAPATGAVLIAGTPVAWSWAVVEDVDDGWERFGLTAAPDR